MCAATCEREKERERVCVRERAGEKEGERARARERERERERKRPHRVEQQVHLLLERLDVLGEGVSLRLQRLQGVAIGREGARRRRARDLARERV